MKTPLRTKTKVLIFPYPNNPTGAVMRREHLKALSEIIIRHDLIVLSDEIYSELTYGGEPHVSIASLPGMKERTIVINGFSKTYAMTGWRMGYAAGPKEIISPMTKLHQYGIMSAPTMSQYAAIEALKNGDDDIAEMRDQYDMRRRLIVDGLNRLGLTCFEPEGAFYVFPSIQSTGMTSDEFCERLIYDKHVAVVPGSAFGACGEGFGTHFVCVFHQAPCRGAEPHRRIFEGVKVSAYVKRLADYDIERLTEAVDAMFTASAFYGRIKPAYDRYFEAESRHALCAGRGHHHAPEYDGCGRDLPAAAGRGRAGGGKRRRAVQYVYHERHVPRVRLYGSGGKIRLFVIYSV